VEALGDHRVIGLYLGAQVGEVLVIGAHSDDIEIGCGGTLLALAEAHPTAHFTWAVLTGDENRQNEARSSAEAFFGGGRAPRLVLGGLRDGHLPHEPAAKALFEQLKADVTPDVVFTHQRSDLHQDHRVAAELALQTFRDHLVLGYEVPKYDGDLGAPNLLAPLTAAQATRKVDHLMSHFASQRSKRWFTDDLFRALMRLRGMESNAPDGYAEGFYAHKLVLRAGPDEDAPPV
jgi:LmbE family N-acetylglucosaminyl deacetylase